MTTRRLTLVVSLLAVLLISSATVAAQGNNGHQQNNSHSSASSQQAKQSPTAAHQGPTAPQHGQQAHTSPQNKHHQPDHNKHSKHPRPEPQPVPDPLYDRTFTLSWPGVATGLDSFKLPGGLQQNSDFTCTIEKSSGASLTGWLLLNGRSLASREFLRGNETTLTTSCSLKRSNTIMLMLFGHRGASVRITISSQSDPAPTASFSVSPESISCLESATLTWSTENAESVSIDNSIGEVDSSGSLIVSPTTDTTYTLTATGAGGSTTASATLAVTCAAPNAVLAVDPAEIIVGESATLTWSSEWAESASITPDIGSVDTSGSQSVSPTETTTYTLTTTGPSGTATSSVTLTVNEPAPVAAIQAYPETNDNPLLCGNSVTLMWETENAETISISPDLPDLEASGSVSVSPSETTIYTITAAGPGGTATDSTTVVISCPEPTASLTADPASIVTGNSATLTWSTDNALETFLDNGEGTDSEAVDLSGSKVVQPEETTTYTLTAKNGGHETPARVTLEVTYPAPTILFSASPEQVTAGESATLSWSVEYADTVTIEPGPGAVDASGSYTVTPLQDTVYTLTASGSGGSEQQTITVDVRANVAEQPEGSFGEQYEDLIATDATEDFEAKRFAVITGAVADETGSPLSNVLITIHGHEGYGSVYSDADGKFSMAVEGGSSLKVHYQMSGYIEADRVVAVPWNDIAVAETPYLVPMDSLTTHVVLDGDAETIIAHASTPVTDDRGTRSARLVFEGDTQVWEVDADGNELQELSEFDVVATDVSLLPENMPADLPEASAFTYCVDFQIPGVEHVQFSKPVTAWVDNFLEFDVGILVPVGYYDTDKAQWVASDDGQVVALVDTDSDGYVDGVDSDGDGAADDIDGDGDTSDELAGLSDDALSLVGATYWRFSVQHFSIYDCNYAIYPPTGAITPDVNVTVAPESTPDNDQCPYCSGPYATPRGQMLHEDIPIAGTGLTLHYNSDQTNGRLNHMDIQLSGEDELPESLNQIKLRVTIAGRTYEQTYDPESGLGADFTWDGKDYLENQVDFATATIKIGYVYPGVYAVPEDFTNAFGQPGLSGTASTSREEFTYWQTLQRTLGDRKLQRAVSGQGWTLANHHRMDPARPNMLFKGDGSIITHNALLMKHVAGTGGKGAFEGPGAALERQIPWPGSGVVGPDGDLYFSSSSCILKLSSDGTLDYYSGNGTLSLMDAVGRNISEVKNPGAGCLTFDSDGNLYFSSGYRIFKVDTDGILHHVAGNGTCGQGGYGGDATKAYLHHIISLTVDKDGNIYELDRVPPAGGALSINKISSDGIIECLYGVNASFTGKDQDGNSKQYSPISVVPLTSGEIIAIDDGSLITKGNGVQFLIKIHPDGTYETIAGNGRVLYTGEPGPALTTNIGYIGSFTKDSTGNIYFSDSQGERFGCITADGYSYSIAGCLNGECETPDESGSLATSSNVGQLYNIGLAASPVNSELYYIAYPQHKIFKIDAPADVASLIGAGEITFYDNDFKYVMAQDGKHKYTADAETGKVLTSFAYDDDGNLASATDRFGNTVTIERNSDGTPTAIIAPHGQRTELNIDTDGLLQSVTFEDNTGYSFEYTDDGLMTAETDPNGNVFTHEYDEYGRLTAMKDPEGGEVTLTEERDDNICTRRIVSAEGDTITYTDTYGEGNAFSSTITSPSGAVKTYEMDTSGMNVEVSLPCGVDSSTTYGLDPLTQEKYVTGSTQTLPSGKQVVTTRQVEYEDTDSDDLPESVTWTTTSNERTTTTLTDYLTSQITATTPFGRVLTRTFDPDTLLTKTSAVTGFYGTSYAYDDQGRIAGVTVGEDDEARTVSYTYDDKGNLASVTDALDRTTTFAYDSVDQLTAITRPDSTSVRFAYDANGNMTLLTTPMTQKNHSYAYNGVDKPVSYQTPLENLYGYTYDKDRRLTALTTPAGKAISYVYTDGQLERISTPEGDIDYTYSCPDKVAQITFGSQSVAYEWDGPLLTSRTLSGALAATVGYTYDDNLQLSAMTYAGAETAYQRDADDLLTSAGAFAITRNADNGSVEAVSDTASGGTFSASFGLNGFGELETQISQVNGTDVFALSLERNKGGQITSKTETFGSESTVYTYTYDDLGRLLEVSANGGVVEQYMYGGNGWRTWEYNSLRGITDRTFSYDAEDRILTAGDTTYAYDADGYLQTKTTAGGVTTYTYDTRGALRSVSLPDGRLIEYTIDPLGRRVAKSVDGTVEEKYLWQGMTRLLAVYDGNDTLLYRFQYAGGRMPVSVETDGATYYLHYDHLGSLLALTNTDGDVLKRVTYDSFGNIIKDTKTSFSILGFAGGLYDTDTGLIRFGYRDYDPETGRWTSKDPISFDGGDANLYAYCGGDPVNWVDVEGLVVPFAIPLIYYTIPPLIGAYIYWQAQNDWQAIPAPTPGSYYDSPCPNSRPKNTPSCHVPTPIYSPSVPERDFNLELIPSHTPTLNGVIISNEEEHTKGKRPSTKKKHEKGQKRKKQKYNDKKRNRDGWKNFNE